MQLKTCCPRRTALLARKPRKLLQQYGPNELVEKKTPSWLIFLQQLYGAMPMALWIAAIIELSLKNYADGGILLFIQFANATIAWYETIKAADAVEALSKGLLKSATVYRDGKWQNIESRDVVPGDLVKLGLGAAIHRLCLR